MKNYKYLISVLLLCFLPLTAFTQGSKHTQADKKGPEWIDGIWAVNTTVNTAIGSIKVNAKVWIDRDSQQLSATDCGTTVARGIYRISGNSIICGDLYIDMDMQNQRLEYGRGVYYRKVSGNHVEEGATSGKREAEKPARQADTAIDYSKVFSQDEVHQRASFLGSESALMQFVTRNIKYPSEAAERGIQGKVVVKFEIGTDGLVSNINVEKGVDPALDREAKRIVRGMPKWTPAKINGREVKSVYHLPINFKLQY